MHDVIIIGGSFAGLAAATQLGRARRDVVVLDNGRPRNRFAAHAHGFLGRDGVPPLEILAEARQQLAPYGTVKFRAGKAMAARRIAEGFVVELEQGGLLPAKRLILAHGMVDDLSLLPGVEACWGRSVFFCPYCHGFEFAEQRLGLLLRHGDALDLARLYMEWTRDFTLFTNGAPMDALVRQALQERGVKVVDDTVLGLAHDAGALRGLETAGGRVALDALFWHAPAAFSTGLGLELGCAVAEGPMGSRYAVDMVQMTSLEGVYAAGDIARQAPNISWAVADGVMAGVAAHRSLLV